VTLVDCLTWYNSIGHPLASIACQCLGSPQSRLKTTFSTIQNLHIFLCTAISDSTLTYGSSNLPSPSFQGVCHRNGMGPTLWLATSIPLIEMLYCHGHVSKFSCPISGHFTTLTGMIYVDAIFWSLYLPWTPQMLPSLLCNTTSVFGKEA